MQWRSKKVFSFKIGDLGLCSQVVLFHLKYEWEDSFLFSLVVVVCVNLLVSVPFEKYKVFDLKWVLTFENLF